MIFARLRRMRRDFGGVQFEVCSKERLLPNKGNTVRDERRSAENNLLCT